MADNVTLPGTGGIIASDDVGGAQYQRVKVALGADGAGADGHGGAGGEQADRVHDCDDGDDYGGRAGAGGGVDVGHGEVVCGRVATRVTDFGNG